MNSRIPVLGSHPGSAFYLLVTSSEPPFPMNSFIHSLAKKIFRGARHTMC